MVLMMTIPAITRSDYVVVMVSMIRMEMIVMVAVVVTMMVSWYY